MKYILFIAPLIVACTPMLKEVAHEAAVAEEAIEADEAMRECPGCARMRTGAQAPLYPQPVNPAPNAPEASSTKIKNQSQYPKRVRPSRTKEYKA